MTAREVFVCQICRAEVPNRAHCHPHYTILCEPPVTKDAHGHVVDCTAATPRQEFKAAKVSTVRTRGWVVATHIGKICWYLTTLGAWTNRKKSARVFLTRCDAFAARDGIASHLIGSFHVMRRTSRRKTRE